MELKKCPFCGGEATTSELQNIEPIIQGWGWIGCPKCKIFIEYVRGEFGKKQAIATWNRREGVDHE